MNKKRIITIAIITTLLLGIAVFATLVRYIVSDVTENRISSSNVKIELVLLEEGEGGQVPVSGDTTVVPGVTKSRIAMVKNTGKEPAWVRVDALVDAPHGTENIEEFGYVELGNVDDEDWAYKDGYWYYDKILNPGETTKALFTEISFTNDLDENYKGQDLSVRILAEGTQSKHNGSTAFDAQGWPEE